MKKAFKFIALTVLTVVLAAMLAGCSNANSEVVGTYQMTSISGTMGGVTVNKDLYEYFTMILESNGNGTVKSKAKGGGAAYEAKGTYTYKDGKITMTTSNGFASVSEEYEYADGVITYKVNNEQMSFSIILTRVEEESK